MFSVSRLSELPVLVAAVSGHRMGERRLLHVFISSSSYEDYQCVNERDLSSVKTIVKFTRRSL